MTRSSNGDSAPAAANTTTGQPFVTIVIPCRNEARYIAECLESVLAGSYPADRLEVLVVDGMSEDGTPEIVQRIADRRGEVRLLRNEGRTVPYALNLAVREARGEVIMRMDAHTTYTRDYVGRCVALLEHSAADNVGGRWVVVPGAATLIGRAIAAVLADPLGVGNARYRTGSSGPRWVDTVPFGCYRRQVFDRVGLFDERLTRGQDMDFNVRLRRAGGRILLAPDIVSYYHARADWWSFTRHNFINGYWATYPLLFGRRAFSPRHLVPLGLVVTAVVLLVGAWFLAPLGWGLGGLAVAYLAGAALVAVRVAVQLRSWAMLAVVPGIVASLHLPYGVGSLSGLVHVVWYGLLGRPPRTSPVYR